MILNASGCLDGLTAPGTARQLDAFVTRPSRPSLDRATSPCASPRPTTACSTPSDWPIPVSRFLDEVFPLLSTLGVPIWVSVGGFCADDYAGICAALPGEAVAAIELNLSCPNVDQAAETAAEIVAACRDATDLPLYAKLSPAVPDVGDAAVAIEEAGADGLSLVNTIRGLALDSGLAPILSRGVGG